VKPQLKSSIFWEKKRKRGWNLQAAGRDSFKRKKERKDITISYSAKSDVWPHPYPHIICICTTFYSLTFPFLTPNHYTIPRQPWLIATQTLLNFPLLLQYTRCSIGISWEWTTTKKLLAERKRVTGRMSDWVIKLEKREGMVNLVITSTDLEVKWHCCSNLWTSYGSRLRHIHRAQVWVISCVLYSRAVIALEFFLISPGFNSFLFL
jgi:hypothetical protein